MKALKNLVDVRTVVSLLTVAVWLYAAHLHAGGPIWAILSTLFLLTAPGYFAYRLIAGYRKTEPWLTLLYSTGLSVVILMITGLLINQLFVWQNLPQPLSLMPLSNGVADTTALLVILASLRKRPKRSFRPIHWQTSWQRLPVLLLCLILPFLAVGGAFTLNNGGSSYLALITMGLVGLLFWLTATIKRGISHLYPVALYSMSLAILLGVSMRGWNITGHDIMQEYQVFQLTAQHAAWHMYYYQDAYNACLSITILPTLLQKLTGVSDPYVFKLVYQVIFALIAPAIYLSLRRYVPNVLALFAAFVFITFPTFLADMPMLNRQEMAFLGLALALLSGLDLRLKPLQRQILTMIFLVGMVLSHYSTSYVAVGTLLIATGLQLPYWLARIMQKRPTIRDNHTFTIISVPILLLTILTVFSWNTLATRTSGNIGKTITGISTTLPAILHHNSPSAQVARIAPKTTADKVAQFQNESSTNRPLPPKAYYPNANQYHLSAVKETVAPQAAWVNRLHVPRSLTYATYTLVKALYAKLTQILIDVGLALLLFWGRNYSKLPTHYTILGVSSLAMIATQVLLPSELVNYGLLRLIQQGLLVLALPIIVACIWLLSVIRIPKKFRRPVLAGFLIGFYWALSGFLPGITGGFTPALATSNSGFYYEAYYTHADEIAADRWLATQTPTGSRVYSDEFARRKTITYAAMFPSPTLAPTAIPIDSYVYLSDSNTTFHSVPHYENGDLIYYAVPYSFLNADKSLLYSSGGVRIYR